MFDYLKRRLLNKFSSLPQKIPSLLDASCQAKLEKTFNIDYIISAYKNLGLDIRYLTSSIRQIGKYRCPVSNLVFFSPQLVGDSAFYVQLATNDWYYQSDKAEYEVAVQFIKPGTKLLEVGCGKGAFAKKLRDVNYCGLELNREAVLECVDSGIHALVETIEEHSCSHPNEYDSVCAFQVLEHVCDPKSFIENALRCLKKGGLFIVSVPFMDGFAGKVSNYVLNMPPHHQTQWSVCTLNSLESFFPLVNITLHVPSLEPLHRQFYTDSLSLRQAYKDHSLDYESFVSNEAIEKAFSNYMNSGIFAFDEHANNFISGHDIIAVYIKTD